MRVHSAMGNKTCEYRQGICIGEHQYGCRLCGDLFTVRWDDNDLVGMYFWPFHNQECLDIAFLAGDLQAIKRTGILLELHEVEGDSEGKLVLEEDR